MERSSHDLSVGQTAYVVRRNQFYRDRPEPPVVMEYRVVSADARTVCLCEPGFSADRIRFVARAEVYTDREQARLAAKSSSL
jgi:hypothetical protein